MIIKHFSFIRVRCTRLFIHITRSVESKCPRGINPVSDLEQMSADVISTVKYLTDGDTFL